jgi:hypothetical protein
MRQFALAALAAFFCLSVFAVHESDRWKGVKMFKKVTQMPDNHPLRVMFGGNGALYEVEYTEEFKNCLANDPDLNRHRRGHGQGQGQGAGAPVSGAPAKAGVPAPRVVSPATWVQPALFPRTAGSSWSAGYDEAREAFVSTTLFPQGLTMGWKLADGSGEGSLSWAGVWTYMDEMLEFTTPYGVIIPYVFENAIYFEQSSGCSGVGSWTQTMPVDENMRGTCRFKMMYLHSRPDDHPAEEPEQPGYEKWQPVYDWRDGVFYEYAIVTP